jgi:hypothetical protein
MGWEIQEREGNEWKCLAIYADKEQAEDVCREWRRENRRVKLRVVKVRRER